VGRFTNSHIVFVFIIDAMLGYANLTSYHTGKQQNTMDTRKRILGICFQDLSEGNQCLAKFIQATTGHN
jgi:hypothetical protein